MLDSIQIDPVAFTIPFIDLDIYWYGILIAFGIAMGALWAARELDKRGQSVDDFFTGLIIVIVVGYISARLWYVAQDMFGNNASYTFVEAINIRAGGVNILGGFLGAFIAAWLFVRYRKLNFWHYADVAGPALLLAQAIGRWANFINQELYGPPTDAPWGILINLPNRLPEYINLPETQRFHPTFLYESILLFLGFIVLVFLNNRYRGKWVPGTLFGIFLIWWGMGRFIVEFYRPDQPGFGDGPITYSMVVSLGFAIAGVLVILQRYGKIGSKKKKPRVYKPKPKRN
jgi:phosphatidylglycerol:prolipoprotein diacylglycerol transferase